MSEPKSRRDESIDDLVRRHLERTAEGIDPRPGFARLQAALWEREGGGGGDSGSRETPDGLGPKGSGGPRDRWGRRSGRARRWVGASLTAASIVLLAAVGVFESRPVQARPELLVREAKKAHLLPLDRCYLVEIRKDSPLYDENEPLTSPVNQTRLWTRGDRFCAETVRPQRRFAWGRDARNTTWIAFGPRRGMRLEADEVPRWYHLYGDLYCIRLEGLLGDLIRDFTLTREEPGRTSLPATEIVQAIPKPGRKVGGLRRVRLEIDAETRVVRRMVIERSSRGKAFATATYTLIDTQHLVDAHYTLEGHLEPGAAVYTKDNEPNPRREMLARWLGPKVAALFPLKGKK